MSQWLDSAKVNCPYCGEILEILIEPLDDPQQYFEDCQVCCQPILIEITPGYEGNSPVVRCLRSDEVP